MDVIKTLRESGIKILETEGADIARWSKLKHNKIDLELFLNYNLAEIDYKTLDGEDRSMVCTSNTTLIKLYSLSKDSEKQKIQHLKSNGIRTKDLRSVDTWDLIDNRRKTMSLNSWVIKNFISITPENILILDELIQKLLKS